ncbi:MAG: replicative DNA helicase, partial [Sphingomonadales bacterium]
MATLASIPPAPADAAPRLPQNPEAEAALLGAMMIDNRLADDIVEVLQDQHF